LKAIVINTGTEILLGDVLNTHLAFIARELFQFGLRIDEQRAIPDGDAIQSTLADVFARSEIVFVTGGLGPTSDDITRELLAGHLNNVQRFRRAHFAPDHGRIGESRDANFSRCEHG